MAAYPTFVEHMRDLFGPSWCIATRPSAKTARYTVVIAFKRYDAERRRWAQGHPAFRLVETPPEGPEKQLIMRAVLRELGA